MSEEFVRAATNTVFWIAVVGACSYVGGKLIYAFKDYCEKADDRNDKIRKETMDYVIKEGKFVIKGPKDAKKISDIVDILLEKDPYTRKDLLEATSNE